MRAFMPLMTLTVVCSLAGCKQQSTGTTDNVKATEPIPAPPSEPPAVPAVAKTDDEKAVHEDVKVAAEGGHAGTAANGAEPGDKKPEVEISPSLNEEEAAGYNKACHFVLNRMVECAKDPGFIKYQKRWSVKGAPAAGTKGFQKRIVSWRGEAGRSESCKSWSNRPGTREHFASKSKIATLLADAKLKCELFGQELDDDGWFPGALNEI